MEISWFREVKTTKATNTSKSLIWTGKSSLSISKARNSLFLEIWSLSGTWKQTKFMTLLTVYQRISCGQEISSALMLTTMQIYSTLTMTEQLWPRRELCTLLLISFQWWLMRNCKTWTSNKTTHTSRTLTISTIFVTRSAIINLFWNRYFRETMTKVRLLTDLWTRMNKKKMMKALKNSRKQFRSFLVLRTNRLLISLFTWLVYIQLKTQIKRIYLTSSFHTITTTLKM